MAKHIAEIYPSGIKVEFEAEELLLDILSDAGIVIDSPCGGKGICGKCRVRAEGSLSEISGEEKKLLHGAGYRLACMVRAKGDVKIFIEDRGDIGIGVLGESLPDSDYAAAVDIGTTSVKLSLVDLRSGQAYPRKSFLNPQRRYGHDVISRISSADDPRNLNKMTRIIRNSVQGALLGEAGAKIIDAGSIRKIMISANTVMTSIFFGLSISSLGRYPYTVPVKEFAGARAGDFGLNSFPDASISAMPAVSAYIGGDLISGLAFTEFLGMGDDIFFIDLGTNGEMFIRHGGKIFAASCAMGPALEGMNISSGMTAVEGALTRAYTSDDNLMFEVLGGTEPVGISGTGLIDLISIFLRAGYISSTGSINTKAANLIEGMKLDHEARRISINDRVHITQKDIRNIQLAKGASLSAAKILINQSGIDPQIIKRVIIAGAFGEYMDTDNFMGLKFIPEFKNANIEYLGNTSLRSAELACIDDKYFSRALELSRKIEAVELSNYPGFNEIFMESLNF